MKDKSRVWKVDSDEGRVVKRISGFLSSFTHFLD